MRQERTAPATLCRSRAVRDGFDEYNDAILPEWTQRFIRISSTVSNTTLAEAPSVLKTQPSPMIRG